MLKFLKLINDERKQTVLKNAKACASDSCSAVDQAQCTVNATDICKYDYAACWGTATDYCPGYVDSHSCGTQIDSN